MGRFQSRNRDAFRFKDACAATATEKVQSCFNLGIEMLFVSSYRWCGDNNPYRRFQSRNRDAFRFKFSNPIRSRRSKILVSISESRCFSFQATGRVGHTPCLATRFNLGIEMLFVSSPLRVFQNRLHVLFQSRNRDAFRFKPTRGKSTPLNFMPFQSRNRDAFRFKRIVKVVVVSISRCFNLGIEMLFVSSKPRSLQSTRKHLMFQSRNRDAFRFKLLTTRQRFNALASFNLGIEMLFVSRQAPSMEGLSYILRFNLGIEMLFVSRTK